MHFLSDSKFLVLVWRFHQMIVFLSVILLNLFDFYYASRMHFIETRSILIQEKLISLMADGDAATLKQLKKTSIELWHLSAMLNERFAYTMLMTVLSKLIVFVIDIYWIYIRIIHAVFTFHFIRKLKFSALKNLPRTCFSLSSFISTLRASRHFINWSLLLL